MTEQAAINKGYVYTGYYKRDMETVKMNVKYLKSLGYEAVVVTIKDSPQSRGIIGRGFATYAERRFLVDERNKKNKTKLSEFDSKRQALKENYEKELKDLDETEARFINEINY